MVNFLYFIEKLIRKKENCDYRILFCCIKTMKINGKLTKDN